MAAGRIRRVQSPKLSPDDVVTAALDILDRQGLPDLTMRRVASALDVQASALYWHFPNKQTLLAALADRIVLAGPQPHPESAWDKHLRAEAFALRDALLAYRDSAEIVSSSLALGLGDNPALTRLIAALRSSTFDALTTRRAASTLLHFVLGHVSLEQQRRQYDSLGVRPGQPTPLHPDVTEADFRFGVDTLIAGLQQRNTTLLPASADPGATPSRDAGAATGRA